MAGKLSFAIAINLLTENFKRGANQVKSALRTLQMQFLTFAAALGAGGLGLTNLVSRFIDVARETNRVTTALKNVSGTMSRYADSQRYLLGIAKKYGLEINALTGNYAKFTAAANASGMSMMEQQKIFESVSRACTAFGMSADDSNGVFLALSQMMSKGKISSEELRLQMGERLPVAIQAMAKAAGVTVGELDKLLKQGKVMSADVLPKFAEALDGMIPNVDTDNLETSVNRLKNTFTELVNSLNIGGYYKKMVDIAINELERLKNGVSDVVAFIISIIVGKLAGSIRNYFVSLSAQRKSLVNQEEVAQAQILAATEKRITAEKILEATLTDYHAIENGKRLATARQVNSAEIALKRAKVAEEKAILAAQEASQKAALVSSTTRWGTFFTTIKLGAAKAFKSLKAMFLAFAPTAIISGITYLITGLISSRRESERIKNIFSEYKKEAAQAGKNNAKEVDSLKRLYNIANDLKNNLDIRKAALTELNNKLGENYSIDSKTLKINGDINGKIKERITLLEQSARAEFYANKKVESEDEFNRLNAEYAQKVAKYNTTLESNGLPQYKIKDGEKPQRGLWGSDLEELYELYNKREEVKKIHIHSSVELAKASRYLLKNSNNPTPDPNPDPDGGEEEKNDLQKAEDDYRDSLATYKNQLDSGAITQGKYNEEIDKLNNDTVLKIGGMLGKSAEANETYARALLGTLNPRVTESANALEELAEVQAQYKKDTDLANTKLGKKLITEDEYRQALIEAAAAAANSAVSIEGIGTAADGFISEMQNVIGENIDKGIKMPKLGARDTTFDYKKTDIDKKKERLDIWVTYRDDLEKQLEKVKDKSGETAKHLQNEFNKAVSNVGNLEDALKFAEVEQDIEEYSESLREASYSGIKDIVSSADRMVSSFENLNDVLNDADSTEWEKIMAVWNAMVSTIDSVNSIISTIENVSAIIRKLAGAEKEVKSGTEDVTESVGNTLVSKGVEVAANEIATGLEIEASKRKTAAAMTEMAAKSTAAYASIPFAGVGLAAGQIAAMTALVTAASQAIPKFANGGIVTGNSTSGDKVLARLNSGEMVLNAGQQSRLFNAINSGNLGSNGSGNVMIGVDRVRGSDIYLSLKNYMKTTGKKL